MDIAATIVVAAFSVWLIGVGLFALAKPMLARRAIGWFAGSAAVHFGELGLRALVGLALVRAAPLFGPERIIELTGWAILASSVAIMLAPRRWHRAYALYWSRRMPILMLLAGAALSVLAGGWMLIEIARR